MHPKKIGLALLALLTVTGLMPLSPNVTAPLSMSQALAQTPSSRKAQADRLLLQGIDRDRAGQPEAALTSFQESLTIYREVNDRLGEGRALMALGIIHRKLRNPTKAIELFEQSLAIAKEIKDSELTQQVQQLLSVTQGTSPINPNSQSVNSQSPRDEGLPSNPPNEVQVKDVPGWNNTRWGMTIKQVQALYPFRDTEPSPDGGNQVGLYNVKLDGHQYEARFVFKQDKLIAVSLGWKPKAGDSTSPSSEIRKNLAFKHGTPEEKFKGVVYVWSLPTTKITLLAAGNEMATVIYENAATSIMNF